MNTATTLVIESDSLEATLKLAEQFGQKLKGGEVFELISDLGGGKTAFTQGLAKGLCIAEPVVSPTFMIERVYRGRLTLHHFDFYRLGEAGIVGEELREALEDKASVSVIEWGDVVHDVLPEQRIRIEITKSGDTSRTITMELPIKLAYLMPEVFEASNDQ